MPRLRILYSPCRPGLILTDTPRPKCPYCHGDGGREHDYGDYWTGEYAGTDWEPCDCWNPARAWTLLPIPPLPTWLQRHRDTTGYRDPWGPHGYSDEPPF